MGNKEQKISLEVKVNDLKASLTGKLNSFKESFLQLSVKTVEESEQTQDKSKDL